MTKHSGASAELRKRKGYYVIELNSKYNAVNVFLCQPDTDPVTFSCRDGHDSPEEWGFTAWEQVLAHCDLRHSAE